MCEFPCMGAFPKGPFPPLTAHWSYQSTPAHAPVPTPLAGWMSNQPAVTHPSISYFPSADSEHQSKRARPMGMPDEMNPPINLLSVNHPQSHSQATNSYDDLPKTVARTLNQGSKPMSMNFHPIQQTLLLVGTSIGDICLWDVGTKERLLLTNFKVVEPVKCSLPLQNALVKDPGVSVNSLKWSSDGNLFGVAYSKHLVHIYSYNGRDDIKQHLEIEAHLGGVNDIAFSTPFKQLCFVTCGDDRTVKVWEAATGTELHSFEGHGAPATVILLSSVAASPKLRFNKEGTLLAVSTADNGIKILANADGLCLLRTFESRTIDPYLLSESSTQPIFKSSTTAAAASSSGIADRDASTIVSLMNGENRNLIDVKPRTPDMSLDESMTWKFTEINEPAQCRSLRLVHNMRSSKIERLIYTNSGAAILALASNAVHLLWKWTRNDRNSSGKATVTASIAPQLWQPPSGIIMTNDIADAKPEEAVSCFALSKNDSYVMSASGGKISLFNMMTFKTMTTFMPPPPAATFLAFHPEDNNIIAIGMDDSTIQIYNVRTDEVKSKLYGHCKRITGLAFSRNLNILISAGADSQLFAWNMDGWEKLRNKPLQIPQGRTPNPVSDTKVQFHMDQIHFLVVHETQLAILDAYNFVCTKQWVTPENSAPISHAVFSCDSQLIYASFLDATVCVFVASLEPISRISPNAYIPATVGSIVFPVVIAAHPSEPNQFALGLTDGGDYLLEPLETEGKWGLAPPSENGSSISMPPTSNAAAASTSTAAAAASGQPHSQR